MIRSRLRRIERSPRRPARPEQCILVTRSADGVEERAEPEGFDPTRPTLTIIVAETPLPAGWLRRTTEETPA